MAINSQIIKHVTEEDLFARFPYLLIQFFQGLKYQPSSHQFFIQSWNYLVACRTIAFIRDFQSHPLTNFSQLNLPKIARQRPKLL